jgi:hypothetical protein
MPHVRGLPYKIYLCYIFIRVDRNRGAAMRLTTFCDDALRVLMCAGATRKRNSKKELVEFDVTARWPGKSVVT